MLVCYTFRDHFVVFFPFFQYFPKTITTWGLYCLTAGLTITVVKLINLALHVMYDKAQTISNSNLKNPIKALHETQT